jgi:hypothetical protein
MRAYRQQPARHRPVTVLQGAFDQRLLLQGRLQFAPQGNPFEQGAGSIDPWQPVTERGIHMKMGVHERRRDQIAGGINDAPYRSIIDRQAGGKCDDATAIDGDINMPAAIRQAGVADKQIHAILLVPALHGRRSRVVGGCLGFLCDTR